MAGMNFTPRVTFFILCALFVAAVAARVSIIDPLDSPYFKRASAMSYRHMLAVADGQSLRVPDAKAGHPDGYIPARYRASGAETITGIAYRAMRLVSDIDGRPFTRRMIVFMASLCVFTAYGVSSRLWGQRGPGLLAAFMVAFLPALVHATNGRVFAHIVFAAFFATLYAAIALRALPRSTPVLPVAAALVALLLLWVWEPARYGIAACVVAVALATPIGRRTRIWFVLSHAVVVVTGVLLIPHLAALHAIGAWTTAAVLCAALVALLPDARRTRWRAALVLVAGTVVLTLAATPLRAGASEQ